MAEEAPDWNALMQEGRHAEFVLELERRAERAKVIAAKRPPWSALSQELLTLRELTHAVLLDGDRDPLSPVLLKPPVDGCWLLSEADSLRDRRLNPQHDLVLQQVGAYSSALSDHLFGLASVMIGDPPVRPALVLSRVLLDAATHLAYLIEPGIGAATRTTRAANIRLEGLFAELTDAELDADHPTETSLRLHKEIDDLYARGEADGLARATSRKGVAQRHFEPALVTTQAMSELILQSLGPSTWRLLSSVVHAQDRSVIEFVTGRGDTHQRVQGRAYGALHTAPSVLATTEALKLLATAMGRDNSKLTAQADRVNVVWSFAAGLRDADL